MQPSRQVEESNKSYNALVLKQASSFWKSSGPFMIEGAIELEKISHGVVGDREAAKPQ